MATITAYYLFDNLPQALKEKHGIKTEAKDKRFDCVKSAMCWGGAECLTTKKGKGAGQWKMTLTDTHNFVKVSEAKRGAFALKANGNLNLSSIHLVDTHLHNGYYVGTGTPPNGDTIWRGRKANPLKAFGNDGFIVLLHSSWQYMEILFYANSRHFIRAIATDLINNCESWERVEQLRKSSTAFYEY